MICNSTYIQEKSEKNFEEMFQRSYVRENLQKFIWEKM